MAVEFYKGFVTKDRGYWRAIIDWKDEEGNKHRKSKSTGFKCSSEKGNGRNKSKAQAFLDKWRAELVAAEEKAQRCSSTEPLADYIEDYLDTLDVKPSTMSSYKACLQKIKADPIADIPICEVTADDVRRWEKGMRKTLSNTTISHNHAFLAHVTRIAFLEGKIEKNPMTAVKAPRRSRKPANSANATLRSEILAKMAKTSDHHFAMAVRMALLTGMRRGEICALRWQDVDLDTRTIHVVHGLTKGTTFELSTPKDPAGGDSTRYVPFGRVLEGFLRELKTEEQAEVHAAGKSWSESLFVIGNHLTGKFFVPDTLSRQWSMLVKTEDWRGSQGEYIRFHDLRHTFATLCIKDRVMDIMALARILGHHDPSTTLDIYADALDESKRSGMNALDLTL